MADVQDQAGAVGEPTLAARVTTLRREITALAAANPRVWSVDGATFSFDLVTEVPPAVGAYVQLETRDGTVHLGQVTADRPQERPGPTVELDVSELHPGLSGATASVAVPIRAVVGGGPLLATVDADGRVGPPQRRAFDDARLGPADPDLVARLLAGGDDALALGSLLAEPTVPVSLRATGFGRHSFVCGQSGSGKTFTLGKLLEQLLLRTTLRLVVLDPNSDYVSVTTPRDDGGGDPDRARELARLEGMHDRVRVLGGPGSPMHAIFGRLDLAQQALVLGVDPVADPHLGAALRRAADRAPADYTLGTLLSVLDAGDDHDRALAARTRGLGVPDWQVWAEHGEATVVERLGGDWRAAVFDLGALGSARERAVVAGAVLATLWERRYDRRPRLVVIDEAHNVCPARPRTDAQAAAAEVTVDIAAEGRKFGLYLLLSTQEPHKVHPDVLSQCANLFLMRTTSREALDRLASVFSDVPAGLIELAPTLGRGEGVVAGRVAPHPLTFRTGMRLSMDGGRDVPADWATSPGGT